MKIQIKKKEIIDEMSSMGGGAVQGHVNAKEKEELEEMYSTSGAMMGSGSGQGPYERSPEGHERYVRMRHELQGLENFKQNRYFAEDQKEKPKRKIKIRRSLGEISVLFKVFHALHIMTHANIALMTFRRAFIRSLTTTSTHYSTRS